MHLLLVTSVVFGSPSAPSPADDPLGAFLRSPSSSAHRGGKRVMWLIKH